MRTLSLEKKILVAAAVLITLSTPALSQRPGPAEQKAPAGKTARAAAPSFEVASVRPSDPNAPALPPNVRERGLVGVGGRFDT